MLNRLNKVFDTKELRIIDIKDDKDIIRNYNVIILDDRYVAGASLGFNQNSCESRASILLNSDDKGLIPIVGEILKNKSEAGFMPDIITFGFSQRASVTVSSFSREDVIICVQRGFRALTGKRVGEQEFPVRLGEIASDAEIVKAANLLPAVTAALCIGIETERINQLLFYGE